MADYANLPRGYSFVYFERLRSNLARLRNRRFIPLTVS
ncbi:MAG: hypothetical protein QOI12_3926 [Alphaproteobacteria bacterium]|jgi:hypothetical protein|nr:hypothetical protein [Alphaproteobacteria bacterium]